MLTFSRVTPREVDRVARRLKSFDELRGTCEAFKKKKKKRIDCRNEVVRLRSSSRGKERAGGVGIFGIILREKIIWKSRTDATEKKMSSTVGYLCQRLARGFSFNKPLSETHHLCCHFVIFNLHILQRLNDSLIQLNFIQTYARKFNLYGMRLSLSSEN